MCILNWIGENAGIIIAIAAVATSVISLVVAIKALKIQRKHNGMSVKPIAHFSVGDYENCIFVKLKNYGIGPLIIESFEVYKNETKYLSVIDSLGDLSPHITWDTFTGSIHEKVLSPDKEFVLLKGSFDENQKQMKQAIRKSLAETKAVIKYKDIYNQSQPTLTEEFTWFAR